MLRGRTRASAPGICSKRGGHPAPPLQQKDNPWKNSPTKRPDPTVQHQISGSGKRSKSIQQAPKAPLQGNGLTRGVRPHKHPPQKTNLTVQDVLPIEGQITSFSLLDRARPVFSFSSGRKRENGGCNAPAIADSQSALACLRQIVLVPKVLLGLCGHHAGEGEPR